MSITLTGTGGLWTRHGIIGAGVRDANRYLGSTDLSAGGIKSVGVRATNIEAQYQSALQNEVDSLYSNRDSTRSALSGWKSYLQGLDSQSVIDQANADVALISKDLPTALTLLIQQMVGSGTIYSNLADNRIKYNAVSVAAAVGKRPDGAANVGNGSCVVSVLRPDARPNEYVIAEVMRADCTADAATGSTARSEPFTLAGQVAQPDLLAFDWPLGSGGSGSLTTTDAQLDAGQNLLVNSDFETWTVTNIPDNWTILVGVASTDIFKETSVVYTGSAALKFTGTGGSPLSSIVQTMNVSSSGTSGTLAPNTVYCFNFFAKKSASLLAGVIKVDLVDGSNTAITDDAGTAISKTVAFGTLTTSYAAYNFAFATPKTPTAYTGVYKLRVSVSTALTSGESVYIDDLSLTAMTQVGNTGVYVSIFAGSTAWAKGDRWNITVSNDYGGNLQTYCWRIFNMPSLIVNGLSLQFPSDNAAGETIADTLFT